MVRVAPIKLQVGPKVLWFDPNDLDIHAGDDVIVSTSRGLEYGIATSDVLEVSDELVEELKAPLKPVVRLATPQDMEKVRELEERSTEALRVFKEIAFETNEDMHPVLVEFLFEGDKAVFYFEAEERVDFRELVRRLASQFHVRVDMRQIGVRDGARIIGGLGHCGQELCCKRFGSEFSPVSIRMAKEQNLSLNPQKISGVCGRLMCCLRYEYETYKEFNARAPKMGAKVETPEGIAKVTDVNVPTETIALTFEDGTVLKIPLDDFEKPEEGRRPHVISQEVYDRFANSNPFDALDSAGFADVVNFTSEDIVATVRDVSLDAEGEAGNGGRRRRRRRSRSGKESRSDMAYSKQKQGASKQDGAEDTSSRGSKNGKDTHRTRRNRRGGSAETDVLRSSNGGKRQGSSDSSERKDNSKNKQSRSMRGSASSQGSRRPGQRSSGLSSLHSADSDTARKSDASKGSVDNAHRRSRRRRHTTGGDANNGRES